MNSTDIVISVSGSLALFIGVVALWHNPKRTTNQIFAIVMVIIAIRSLCIYSAIRYGKEYNTDHVRNPVYILRVAAAIAIALPWVLWLLKESLLTNGYTNRSNLVRSLPWLIIVVVLATFSFSNGYYKSIKDADIQYQRHGLIYTYVNIAVALLYGALIVQSWSQARKLTGIIGIQLRSFVLNLSLGAIIIIAILEVSHIANLPQLRNYTHYVVVFYCCVCAWTAIYYRIFDTKHIFLVACQKAILISILLVMSMIVFYATTIARIDPVYVIMLLVTVMAATLRIDKVLTNWLGLNGIKALRIMRVKVIDIASEEPHPERLKVLLEAFVRDECKACSAGLLVDTGASYSAGTWSLFKTDRSYDALKLFSWATPESLTRRRSVMGSEDLRELLLSRSLGLIMVVPRGSPTPTMLMALGTKTNEWPYTYPEIERLQNVAELMDNILTRSRLTLQAAIQAKIEHLAMMSRGLAHDLNNLITPISSFLVHTSGHYPASSSGHEVHEAAQRATLVMKDYVREAMFFSQQLAPNFGAANLRHVFQEVQVITSPRAAGRDVTVELAMDQADTLTADAVLLQRMLVNLVSNAIDASERGQVVTLAAKAGRPGWVCLQVLDSGCGIAPENIARIFDPYYTTKKYGEEVRGFGLGLTICQKIVHLHGGTISLKSRPAAGTVATVELPAVQKP